MADKSKILQNAQHYMAKGQIDKAIVEWKKLISESPNDGNIYNTIGDLYLKIKKTPQALETYLKGAESFREAGFALKTIAVYKKLIKIAPERIDILVSLGDLNVERGMANNAIQDYLSAAKKYSQSGQIKESLNVYRKIADLDPSKTAHREKLAEMCLKGGLKQDAVTELVKLRTYYKENNKSSEAGSVQDKINSIDPTGDLQAAAQKASGGPEAGKSDKTGKAEKKDPLAEADALIGKNEFEKALDILTSFISENEGNASAHGKLATAQLKTGKKDEAFESIKRAVHIHNSAKEYGPAGKLLKNFLNADPDRIDAHILLGEVYEKAGNPSLAVPSFALAIDEYLISGDTAAASDLYSKLKTLDPNHRDVRRLRHSCESAESEPAQAALSEAARETSPDPVPAPESVFEATQEAQSQEVQGSQEKVQPAGTESSAGSLVDPAALEEYFTEAEVFLKYGLMEKAVDQMNKVLALDPENTTAHEKLKEYYLDKGQNDKAVAECLKLMELYKGLGDSQKREAIITEAKNIDPENPQLKEATELSPLLESGRLDALLEEEAADSPVESPAPGLELEGSLEATSGPPESPMADQMADPMADQAADPMADQAADPMADQMADPIADQMADPMADQAAQPAMDSSGDAPATSGIPVADEQDVGLSDIEEILSEADFYFSQGIVDEAQKLYEQILAQDPLCSQAREKLDSILSKANANAHEPAPVTIKASPDPDPEKTQEEIDLDQDLDQSFSSYMHDAPQTEAAEAAKPDSAAPVSNDLEKIKEENKLEEDLEQSFSSYMSEEPASSGEPGAASPAPKGQAPPKNSEAEDMVDLSQMLNADEFGAELESLFEDVEKENQEEAEEEEIDYENHYNLGIAYKEMGLLSEAISEFENSVKGPDRFIDSSHMLAGCYQETGETGKAIDLLNNALADAKCDENQKRWLRYDLASFHEKDNKLEQALEEFQTIQNSDPNFKDVSKRIKILGGLLGKGEPVEETSQDLSFDGDEDLELMMDKIFGEISSPDLDTGGKVGAAEPGSGNGAKKKDRISYL